MLDFMYYGSYVAQEAVPSNALFHSLLLDVKAVESLYEDVEINSVVSSLFIHLEMNSIADFYDVYQLRETAVEEIRSILVGSWEQVFDWYPAFVEATFKKTTDSNLHSLLVDISLSHFTELDGSVFGRDTNVDAPVSFFSSLLAGLRNGPTTSITKMFQLTWCRFCEMSDGGLDSHGLSSSFTIYANNTSRMFTWDSATQNVQKQCPYCSRKTSL